MPREKAPREDRQGSGGRAVHLSTIDTEARALLLKRRQALRRTQGDGRAAERSPGEEVHTASESARLELAEIEAALGRIEQGSYGTCVSCGGPLGLQRLRALPEARFCVGCSGHRPVDD